MIQRDQLVYRALAKKARLVSISGVPGAGRTSLLGLISDAIRADGGTVTNIRAKAGTDVAYIERTLEPVLKTGRPHYLVIDEFDWVLSNDGAAAKFSEFLSKHSVLHAVLVTIDRLPAVITEEFVGTIETFRNRDLLFCPEEVLALIADRIGHKDVAKARMVIEVTGGFADAVVRAVDILVAGDVLNLSNAIAQSLVRSRAEVYYNAPDFVLAQGFVRLGWELSFLPRFSAGELQRKEAQFSKEAVQDLINSQALAREITGFATEYVWKPRVWDVYLELNADFSQVREGLAEDALGRGEFCAAFEQYILLGDYSAAENLAERHWLTIYRAMAPEVMAVVSVGLGAYLQSYPMVSAMGIYAADGPVPRATLLKTLRLLRKKSTAASDRSFGCTVNAVTALVLLRDGKFGQAASASARAMSQCLEMIPDITGKDAEQLDVFALALEAAEVCVGVRAEQWTVFAMNSHVISSLPAEIVDYMNAVTGFNGHLCSAKAQVRRTPLLRAWGKFAGDQIMELVRTNPQGLARNIGEFSPDLNDILPANILALSCVLSEAAVCVAADGHAEVDDVAARVRKFFGVLLAGKVDAARAYFAKALSMTVYATFCAVCIDLTTANYAHIKQQVLEDDTFTGQRMTSVVRFIYALALTEARQSVAALGQMEQAWEQNADETRIATIIVPRECFELIDRLDRTRMSAGLVAQIEQARELESPRIPIYGVIRELTDQERKIVSLLYSGMTVKEIGEQLFLSTNTVRAHIRNARLSLGADSRETLIAKARSFGFLEQ